MSLDRMSSHFPEIGSEVSLLHPLDRRPVVGTIVVYTCSEEFEHVDGVNVDVDGDIIDCHLYDVEVR